MSLKRLPTRAENALFRYHGQMIPRRFQESAGDPRKTPFDGPNGAPATRIVAVDLDLLAAFELLGGVVVLARSAADIHVLRGHGGFIGERHVPTLRI